jgi:hypothetical protein
VVFPSMPRPRTWRGQVFSNCILEKIGSWTLWKGIAEECSEEIGLWRSDCGCPPTSGSLYSSHQHFKRQR